MMPGGKTAEKDADEHVQGVLDQLREKSHDLLKEKLGEFSELRAVKYCTQVVAGTNYFIKASLGNGRFAHLRVFKPLPVHGEELQLHSTQTDKNESDPIAFF